MAEENSFQAMIRQVRLGDDEAATRLVHQFEPEIRRIIRVRLADSRMRRLLDSADIAQSVMANFFVRAANGQFEIDSPQDLLKLLVTMAANRFRDQVRKQQATRRGQGKVRGDSGEFLEAMASPAPDPGREVALKDLLQVARQQMSQEEQYLADQRGLGRDWEDLARELGEKPDALRKRLSRALDRVGKNLGLEEFDDD